MISFAHEGEVPGMTAVEIFAEVFWLTWAADARERGA